MHAKTLILSTAFLMAGAAYAEPADSYAENTEAVEQVVAKFYTGLNAMFTGDVAPMQEVWSHADDVTYLGPDGGFQIGWEQVGAQWEAQAALKLGGRVEPRDLHITAGDDLAVVQCYEQGNNLDGQGQPEAVSIRATNVFRKENGEWKMIGHHTDLLPFLQEQSLTKSVE